MRLLALEAHHFRNFHGLTYAPSERFNVFVGQNGQGKTNLLEAVYLVASLRGFRAGKNEEMVQFGQEKAQVRARVRKGGLEHELEVEVAPGKKTTRLDSKSVRALDYFGAFNVVLFAPEHLELVRGSPSGRRRFMDRALANSRVEYLAALQKYEKILRSRNAQLELPRNPRSDDVLDVIDEQLVEAALPLIAHRERFVVELAPLASEIFLQLTRLGLALSYQTKIESGEQMLGELRANRGRDRERGRTSAGPHQDELPLLLEGRAAAQYASQGQARAIVLALKIAEIRHLTTKLGDSPVLLLDDVSSDLDAERAQQLFEFLQKTDCQTFVTTTDLASIRLPESAFHVSQIAAGQIIKTTIGSK